MCENIGYGTDKYFVCLQVTPCSVRLCRESADSIRHVPDPLDVEEKVDEESTSFEAQQDDTNDANKLNEIQSPETSTDADEFMASTANALAATSHISTASSDDQPLNQLKRKRAPKKPTDPMSSNEILTTKRRRTPTFKNAVSSLKKPIKPKPRPQLSICFLCGAQFPSSIQLTQHQKTHFASTVSHSPVFPCNVCGRQVKNLKIHLRQHQNEEKQQHRQPLKGGKMMKKGKRSKSNESQKSAGSNKPAREQLAAENDAATMSSDTLVKLAEASSSTDAVFSPISCDTNKGTELISSNEALTDSIHSNLHLSSYNLIGADILEPLPTLPVSSLSLATSSSSSPYFVLPSAPAIDPLSISDENPLEIQSMDITDPISVNEPSQSTLAMETIDAVNFESIIEYHTFPTNGSTCVNQMENQMESNTHLMETVMANEKLFKCPKCSKRFDTLDGVTKHSLKHEQRTNCEFCGKLLATSYVKVHVLSKCKKRKIGDKTRNVQAPTDGGNGGDEQEEEDEEEVGDDETGPEKGAENIDVKTLPV